jgi:hypothetical protein
VKLQNGPNGRTLVATKDVEAGGTLLTVPQSVLLTAHRSGVIGGLQGQTDAMWDAAGDLREEVGAEAYGRGAKWDVRLACAVFEACSGAGGPFWDTYRRLLPPPPKLTHPLALPAALLPELQDAQLEAKTLELRSRLHELYPLLADHACHPATNAYRAMGAPMDQIPLPLEYCYGLVVSRCFAMADGDTFAFVPFLDMADHAARPCANFASDPRGFTLRALRPVAAGEPVTICYGEDYTSRRLFSQYGFAPAEGTAADSALLLELVDAAIVSKAPGVAEATEAAPSTPLGSSQVAIQALGAALSAQADSPLSTSERRGALFDVLVPEDSSKPDRTDGTGEGTNAMPPPRRPTSPAVLLAAVRWGISELPTSLAHDEEQLSLMLEAAGGNRAAADPRLLAVLDYRIAWKRLLAFTESTLATFLGD